MLKCCLSAFAILITGFLLISGGVPASGKEVKKVHSLKTGLSETASVKGQKSGASGARQPGKSEKRPEKNSITGQEAREVQIRNSAIERKNALSKMKILDRTVEELKKMGRVETFDFNRDHEIDVWVYYKPDSDDDDSKLLVDRKAKLLLRKDLDINFDGKIDIRRQYEDGEVVQEIVDFDYDGKFDAISFFKDGRPVLKEFDFQGDGKTDVWKYYNGGRLVLKEVDRNFDGRADLWVYFLGDRISRIGQDTDGDGTPDKWSK